MKLLVTGGCGFLGSHVCEYFIKKEWDVISFDNLTKHELSRTGFNAEKARNHNLKFLKKIGVNNINADIRDFDELLASCDGCDYLIHTAAQPAMTVSWEDPFLDMTTNINGTVNVLEVARRYNIPVVSCASVHVYGNSINNDLIEEDTKFIREPETINENLRTLGGKITPLHASKASADIYTKVYIDTYNTEAASFRLTGIYGTRQFGGEDHGWVANFSIRTICERPITIFGTGKQVRDIIYATDVCAAFEAFYKKRKSGIYNIGGGHLTKISLLECIDIIEDIYSKSPKVNFEPERHGDLSYFVCDITKAQSNLKWSPKITPKVGIAKLIKWIELNESIFRG